VVTIAIAIPPCRTNCLAGSFPGSTARAAQDEQHPGDEIEQRGNIGVIGATSFFFF
jgi:hypothetical protein